jgi:hypothetical protein
MEYQWGDEFNNKQIDHSKWLTHLPWSKPVAGERIVY